MKKDIKLILSGSGTLLYYHIGAYARLYETFNITDVVGTSGGSIVAGLITVYRCPKVILEALNSFNLKDMKDFNLNPFDYSGIISGNKILTLFKKHFNYRFKDIDFNCNIISTQVEKLSEKIFNRVDTPNIYLYDSIRASMSISTIFKPHLIEGKQYIDGGYSNNIAYDFFGENENTFAVKIDSYKDSYFINNILDASLVGQFASIKANEKKHLEDNKIGNRILIKSKLDGLSFDFDKKTISDMIQIGYDSIDKYLYDKTKEIIL